MPPRGRYKPTGRLCGRPTSVKDDDIVIMGGRKWRLTEDGSLFAERRGMTSPRGRTLWQRFPADRPVNQERIEIIRKIRKG